MLIFYVFRSFFFVVIVQHCDRVICMYKPNAHLSIHREIKCKQTKQQQQQHQKQQQQQQKYPLSNKTSINQRNKPMHEKERIELYYMSRVVIRVLLCVCVCMYACMHACNAMQWYTQLGAKSFRDAHANKRAQCTSRKMVYGSNMYVILCARISSHFSTFTLSISLMIYAVEKRRSLEHGDLITSNKNRKFNQVFDCSQPKSLAKRVWILRCSFFFSSDWCIGTDIFR